MTQKPHFLITVTLTFVITPLLVLGQESRPILEIGRGVVRLSLERGSCTFRRQCPFQPNACETLALQQPQEGPSVMGTPSWRSGEEARHKRLHGVWFHVDGIVLKGTFKEAERPRVEMGTWEIWAWWECSRTALWWWLHNSKTLLAFTELNT